MAQDRRPVFGSRYRLPWQVSYAAALLHWSLLSMRPGKAPRLLLVLSHQRSGSTLLMHCLNTHPALIGYGETVTRYVQKSDLYCLPTRIAVRLRQSVLRETYFIDKLLYDELLPDPSLLQLPNVYTIFLIRDAKQALSSLINAPKLDGWPQRPEANRDYVDHANCERYYSSRLDALAQCADSLAEKKNSLLLTYDDIVNHTGLVFSALAQLLSVDNTFSEQYRSQNTTGVSGYGDVSENIREGRILRTINRPKIELEPELVESATRSFARCYASLEHKCTTIQQKSTGPDKN